HWRVRPTDATLAPFFACFLQLRGLRSPWGHEVSAERRDRKKPLMAERTKRSATPKMGAQGIQFQRPINHSPRRIARVVQDNHGNIIALCDFASEPILKLDEAIVGVEFDDGHIAYRRK